MIKKAVVSSLSEQLGGPLSQFKDHKADRHLAEKAIRQLTDQQMGELVDRLLLYTHRKLQRWDRRVLGAEDIVHTAIQKVLEGTRIGRDDISLFFFLVGVINSEIGHAYTKEKRELPHEPVELIKYIDLTEETLQTSRSPEEIVLTVDNNQQILQAFEDDEMIKAMVRALISEGRTSSREIAEALGVSVQSIYNIKKRFRRRLRSMNRHKTDSVDSIS